VAADIKRRVRAGQPSPLGAVWDGKGVNFALFSAHATKVELCLFDAQGGAETGRIELPEYTDQVFHGWVEGLGPGQVYGYRVHGAYEPQAGHRFNPNKLLLDPYARAHAGALVWNPACFGYKLGDPLGDLSFDPRDSAPFVPKCVVIDPAFPWQGKARRHPVPWGRTILYEAHTRGFTRLHPGVPEPLRGTYAGFGQRDVLDHISELGVTSVELLPIHSFADDGHLLEDGLANYWGYNTIGFFAPDTRYAADKAHALREFKEMVARLHDAGLEVILDVVYNHTAEGNELGPTLSFRGIDNASYYRLPPADRRYYRNESGTGNTLNLAHPLVMRMVMDSLRYWAGETHVDGFRFDLATILARGPHGFDRHGGFLQACGQDPMLRMVKLIAEPWDCEPGSHHVGGFPPGWAEWNDKFRDTARDFWRGHANAGAMAACLAGSAEAFAHQGRRPWASVNFVTAHDGFTLNDWASYNNKHNEANGEGNRDGGTHDRSWNCGAEGPVDDPGINELRARQRRNMLATLLLARGTPMLLAGDEFARTQHGNNNAYCQDNETSWVNWKIDAAGAALLRFTRKLTGLRREFPALRHGRFLSGAGDVAWLSPSGAPMAAAEWRRHCFGMRLTGPGPALLLILNGYQHEVPFTLPGQAGWRLLLDTANPEAEDENLPASHVRPLAPRSVLLLQQVADFGE